MELEARWVLMDITAARQLLDLLEKIGDLNLRVTIAGHPELVDNLRKEGFFAVFEASAWNPLEVVVTEKISE
jgi:hypothetical protein